jgi:phosphoribosylformimino-5-aminoimidazole carboxamide ribotide isomerase
MMMEPHELVKILNGYDIRDIIVLELSKVGTSAGIDTDFLRGVVELSTHSVLLGGGIRDMADINALKEIRVSGALVATAVHEGRIPVEVIKRKD